MLQRSKLSTGLIAMIAAAISMPSLAERSVQVGPASSVNSSFYEDVGEEYYALPLVIVEYDRFYLQGIRGGYRFFQDEEDQSLALEIRRNFDGYSSDDSDALMGMADRDAAWEAGLAYEVGVAGGQAKAKLMQDISDSHGGFSAQFDYERSFWTSNALMVTWYTGSEYWSSKKTDYYFGVRPEEATSARPIYTADESYRFFLGSNAVKRINKNLTVILNAEYLWATSAVNDSPLTSRQDQWSAYAGVLYQF